MLLQDAGYREKVFWKSWLAESIHWVSPFYHPQHATVIQEIVLAFNRSGDLEYNPVQDTIYNRSGSAIKVCRDGVESRSILTRFGLDDEDCHQSILV